MIGLPRHVLSPLAGTAVLVILGLSIPQPEIQIACFTASFLTAIGTLIIAFRERGAKPRDLTEDEKHIVLFKTPISEDTITCPHCGEVIGLGVSICPRCKRSVH